MTSINCVHSPISSSKLSLATINPTVSASRFSTFCYQSDLVLSESSVCSSASNSLTPISNNPYLKKQLPCVRQKHPLNISFLATVYADYKDSDFITNCPDGTEFEHLLSNQGDEQKMLESLQNQHGTGTNACPNEEDEKALQLAFELTMLNLKKIQSTVSLTSPSTTNKSHQQKNSQNIHSSLSQYSSLSNPYRMTTKVFLKAQSRTVVAAPTPLLNQQISETDVNNSTKKNSLTEISQNLISSVISDERLKKSQNMTECVPVPSSEHVAEIVGRQGCKIKALRAKTNTYIKTPVRNEEPVFVVTGRKEDVSRAKHEILSAAEHFTVIRATRRINDNAGINSPVSSGKQQILGLQKNNGVSCAQTVGQITIQVRVPYRLVGLVVGTKGNTIKHIQHETQTYIVTPSRDKEPIFEVTGLVDNVELARRHIEVHIATRIGSTHSNSIATSVSPPSPSATIRHSTDMDSAESSLHSLSALNHMLNDDLHSEILSSIYKNGICSTLDCGHISVNGINDDKCNSIHSMNGFFGDINVTMLPSEDIERPTSYAINDHVNNQLKCVDFVNNLIDSNNTQFCIEQKTQFT